MSSDATGVGLISADPITTHEQLEAAYQQAIRGRHIDEIAPILALRNKALECFFPSETARTEWEGYPGIAHDLESLRIAAARISDAYHTDPGTSDLDNEQPIHISTTLGDWRALNFALLALRSPRRSPPSATATIAPPSDGEIAAYRDLFRQELDKNMHNSSGSPSTDAHRVALHQFVKMRNQNGASRG